MKNEFERTMPILDAVEAAERSARKRKIKKAVITLSIVVVVAVVFTLLCLEGPFDPRGLIKSRYPWLG